MRNLFRVSIFAAAILAVIVFAGSPAVAQQQSNEQPGIVILPAAQPGQMVLYGQPQQTQQRPPNQEMAVSTTPWWLWPVLILVAILILGLLLLRGHRPTSSVVTDSIMVRHPLRITADRLDLHAGLRVAGCNDPAGPVFTSVGAPATPVPASGGYCGSCGTSRAAATDNHCRRCGQALMFILALMLFFGIGTTASAQTQGQVFRFVPCPATVTFPANCLQAISLTEAQQAAPMTAVTNPVTAPAHKTHKAKATTTSTTPATKQELMNAIEAVKKEPCTCK